ncbi:MULTISPECIES: hypothetical protein [unclassified Empedobacter]|uniref:hypothetical protein n=1 Tax=unclassified Empedobacter TaxID=2643773 RepID=UPI0025BCAFE1|nr:MULTISPECIES: hypothetical protein [unclassified Empedobacter]
MRTNLPQRILLFITILLTLTFWSCATKRKTKEVEQVKVESEKSIVNDSSVNLQLQKSTYDYLQNYSKNETLLQKLGLTYAGKTNEDKGKVSLKQTENGLELDIQGAIAMALEKEQSKNEDISVHKVISLVDSIYSVRLQQDLAQRDQLLLDSFKSNTEKEKTDISIWIYVVIGCVLVVWAGIKQIKK